MNSAIIEYNLGTTYLAGESFSNSTESNVTSQRQASSMKKPSKSSGRVSKRSLQSPEMPTFGRHQYPQAGNNYSERQRYLKSIDRPLTKPESKCNI